MGHLNIRLNMLLKSNCSLLAARVLSDPVLLLDFDLRPSAYGPSQRQRKRTPFEASATAIVNSVCYWPEIMLLPNDPSLITGARPAQLDARRPLPWYRRALSQKLRFAGFEQRLQKGDGAQLLPLFSTLQSFLIT